MGEFDLASNGDSRRGFDLEIGNILVHPQFEEKKAYFDVAVIQTKNIEFTPIIQPICLPNMTNSNGDHYSRASVELTGNKVAFNFTANIRIFFSELITIMNIVLKLMGSEFWIYMLILLFNENH